MQARPTCRYLRQMVHGLNPLAVLAFTSKPSVEEAAEAAVRATKILVTVGVAVGGALDLPVEHLAEVVAVAPHLRGGVIPQPLCQPHWMF